MRTLKVWPIIAAFAAAFATLLPAMAQQQSGDVPPPRLEQLEEGEAPAVTIRQPDRRSKTSEKRAPGGKVTEVNVSTGGSTYHLKANDQTGSALPGDGQSSTMRAAQWEVLEFDLKRSKEADEAQSATVPPPPAAPAAAPKK